MMVGFKEDKFNDRGKASSGSSVFLLLSLFPAYWTKVQ